MSTNLEQANEERTNELLANAEWALMLSGVFSKLRRGFYDQKYVDVIFQKWERFDVDIFDVYTFISVWCWLGYAEIVCAEIRLGEMPGNDKDITGNNEKLARLFSPFSGIFVGGTQGSDGYIKVDTPIKFDMVNLETGDYISSEHCGIFPLEAGYIAPWKTFNYLHPCKGRVGRLARWPYGSESIYLLQRVEDLQ